MLRSLDDRMRTAKDSANRAGCRFNKPIARVSLTLDNGAQTYTEIFHFDPPSLSFGLRCPKTRPLRRAAGRCRRATTHAGSSR